MTLATEEEIASALGKQGVTNMRRISIKKSEEQIQTNTYVLTYSQGGEDQAIVLRELSSTSQHPWGASNAKTMDTTRKPVEDNRHAKCGGKDPDHLEED